MKILLAILIALASVLMIHGACPAIYQPMCATNGITYGNLCLLVRAGALLKHIGECC
ncbi:serine protease inhibitor Kazal-type 1-like [Aphomia sociella]